MPVCEWCVVVKHDYTHEEFFFKVIARTEDGAINRASEQFKEINQRWPHDHEIMKVDRR